MASYLLVGIESHLSSRRLKHVPRLGWGMESEKKHGTGEVEIDGSRSPLERVREEAERAHIILVLQLTGGNRGKAARILGISRKTLWKKAKILGIPWPQGT